MDKLILIATWDCNLCCTYCHTVKKKSYMEWTVAERALELYYKHCSEEMMNEGVIKFSGVEPLLSFGLIKRIVEYSNKFGRSMKYELSTNGLMLDRTKIDFFKKNNFEIFLSIDGDDDTQISGRGKESISVFGNSGMSELDSFIVNMVISPQNVSRFPKNLEYLLGKGFSRFNFLPAFYNNWSDGETILLRKGFERAAEFISGRDIYVKNRDINQPLYLFNDGFVIDTNGDIFSTNAVLLREFKKMKRRLIRGNVERIRDFNELEDNDDLRRFVENNEFHLNNMKIDRELSFFVDSL